MGLRHFKIHLFYAFREMGSLSVAKCSSWARDTVDYRHQSIIHIDELLYVRLAETPDCWTFKLQY